MAGIFKAYDIRGTYPTELDEELAYKIGFAAACILQAKDLVVGGDRRAGMEAGRGAGCLGSGLVETGNGARSLAEMADGEADHVAGDLSGAVDWILTR